MNNSIGYSIKCAKFEIFLKKININANGAYSILIKSKFSHLCMKHNVHHMSTCTESACIYHKTSNRVPPCIFKNRRKQFTNPDFPAVTIASSEIHFLLFFFFIPC